jgi:DNA repair exonuclease SbcCD ATPase subunit
VACQAQIDPPSHSNLGLFGVVVWLPALPSPQPMSSQRVPSSMSAPLPAAAARPALVAAPPAQPTPFTAAVAGPSQPLVAQELEQLRSELRAAQGDITRAQSEAKISQDLASTAQRELRAAKEAFRLPAQELEQLRAELRAAQGDIAHAQADAKSSQELTSAAQRELHAAKEARRLLAQELEQLHSELSAARGDITRAQAKAKSAQDLTFTVQRELLAAQEAVNAATRDPEDLERIRRDIVHTKEQFEAADRELRSVEEALDIQSFGFYAPKYGFESSAHYAARLKGTRDEQQRLIKDEKAAPCNTAGFAHRDRPSRAIMTTRFTSS